MKWYEIDYKADDFHKIIGFSNATVKNLEKLFIKKELSRKDYPSLFDSLRQNLILCKEKIKSIEVLPEKDKYGIMEKLSYSGLVGDSLLFKLNIINELWDDFVKWIKNPNSIKRVSTLRLKKFLNVLRIIIESMLSAFPFWEGIKELIEIGEYLNSFSKNNFKNVLA